MRLVVVGVVCDECVGDCVRIASIVVAIVVAGGFASVVNAALFASVSAPSEHSTHSHSFSDSSTRDINCN